MIFGKAVEEYAQRVQLAATIYSQHRLFGEYTVDETFPFQSKVATSAMRQLKMYSGFKGCKESKKYGSQSFYSQAFTFQQRETFTWRGEVKKASVIIPPLSMQDETSNLGAAKVILTMLRLSGLLVKDKIAPAPRLNTPTDQGSKEEAEVINTMEGLDIAPDWEERNLILFRDGLSQVRARAFEELIQKLNHLFGVQHDMKAKLKKVMSRVVHITGDLHGGNFHFLSAVYSLFYGSLIQPIQLMLGWKRIRGSDVTKCYQQAAGLALMIADALEKHLFGTYCVETNKEPNQPFTSIHDPANFSLEVA